MQKIATKVFIYASLTFGVLGILWVLFVPGHDDKPMSAAAILLVQALMACVFIILSSFALSVAGKYLVDNGNENR